MSILIKGASSLRDGLYQIQDGKIHAYKGNGGKTEGYDLIEVPTPHGKLIDADALIMPIERSWQDAGLHGEDYRKIKRWIKNALTIIEAEE